MGSANIWHPLFHWAFPWNTSGTGCSSDRNEIDRSRYLSNNPDAIPHESSRSRPGARNGLNAPKRPFTALSRPSKWGTFWCAERCSLLSTFSVPCTIYTSYRRFRRLLGILGKVHRYASEVSRINYKFSGPCWLRRDTDAGRVPGMGLQSLFPSKLGAKKPRG